MLIVHNIGDVAHGGTIIERVKSAIKARYADANVHSVRSMQRRGATPHSPTRQSPRLASLSSWCLIATKYR